MALLVAISSSDGIPELSFALNQSLKQELCKHRAPSAFLMKGSIKPADISRLKTVPQASQCNLLLEDDHFELIIDSLCSKIVSPNLKIFIPGSLKIPPPPLAMEGIAGQLITKQK